MWIKNGVEKILYSHICKEDFIDIHLTLSGNKGNVSFRCLSNNNV